MELIAEWCWIISQSEICSKIMKVKALSYVGILLLFLCGISSSEQILGKTEMKVLLLGLCEILVSLFASNCVL